MRCFFDIWFKFHLPLSPQSFNVVFFCVSSGIGCCFWFSNRRRQKKKPRPSRENPFQWLVASIAKSIRFPEPLMTSLPSFGRPISLIRLGSRLTMAHLEYYKDLDRALTGFYRVSPGSTGFDWVWGEGGVTSEAVSKASAHVLDILGHGHHHQPLSPTIPGP